LPLERPVKPKRICRLLLVEPDAACGRTLAAVFRRQGYAVRLVSSRGAALRAARLVEYEMGVVDLFVRGGGLELARQLRRRVRRLVLCFGPALARAEVLQAAVGFPIHRKVALSRVLRQAGLRQPRTGPAA
jgi:ActR/RegA family two-component response regulator